MSRPDYPVVTIRKKRIVAVQRRHPWIFSGAIAAMDDVEDGGIVRVLAPNGKYLATGYYHDGSIAIRILSFDDDSIDLSFWNKKIEEALRLRRRIGLPSSSTNAFRLVHGEGDGIPGLIIDIYDQVAVIQCHTAGIYRHLDQISKALTEKVDFIDTIYHKSAMVLNDQVIEDGFILGSREEVVAVENDHQFRINVRDGQKTGFFLDQRDNRALVKQLSKGQRVLNLYAYTGGFSIYSLAGGASEVVSVDISATAVDMMEKNVALGGYSDRHLGKVENVHDFLRDLAPHQYDMIILDPPAFAKSQRKRHNAVQAYKRINAAAIKKIKPGGLLLTFSCSQVVDAQLFYNTITAAAMEVNRTARVIHRLSQGPDHPVSLFHPEGEYLKGLVIEIGL